MSIRTAHAYITVIDGVSITVALYGLLIFYGLTKEELSGKKPLCKFLSIKLIVMFTFYQGLIFHALGGRVIHATQYWTETNIADGLKALAIRIEMVIFSAFMMYAYSWRECIVPGHPRMSISRPLWDSINYSTYHSLRSFLLASSQIADHSRRGFAIEIAGSLKSFIDFARGKPSTRGPRVHLTDSETGKTYAKMDFGEAFGVTPRPYDDGASYPMSGSAGSGTGVSTHGANGNSHGGLSAMNGADRSGRVSGSGSGFGARQPRPRESYDENVRLAPYTYEGGNASSSCVGQMRERIELMRRTDATQRQQQLLGLGRARAVLLRANRAMKLGKRPEGSSGRLRSVLPVREAVLGCPRGNGRGGVWRASPSL